MLLNTLRLWDLGKASLPSGGGHAAAFRNLLWAELDQMVGTLDQCLAQVRMLYVTLQKKRSSAGNVTLLSCLCNYVLKNLDNPNERDGCIAIMMILYNGERNCSNDASKFLYKSPIILLSYQFCRK